MTAALAATMSPRAVQLLGAMRRNLELLVELEKSDPAGVATIVAALVSHLRSWKPLAATEVPVPLGPAPVERGDSALPRVSTDGPIHVELGDGAFYEIGKLNGKTTLYLHDSLDHDADVAMSREQVEAFLQDVSDAIGIGAARAVDKIAKLIAEHWREKHGVNPGLMDLLAETVRHG